MRTRIFIWIAILTVAAPNLIPQTTPQPGPLAAEAFGTIQGTIMRLGTSDPIPDVQITVNGNGNRFAELMGPMSPQQAQAMAQSIVDTAARGTAVPAEFLQAAQEAVLGDASRKAAAPLTAVSDSAGHFTIKDVPVGRADVRAQLKGYFAPPVNGDYASAVTINAEVAVRQTATVHLSMIPGGTISGRVQDANGKPMSDTPVQVLRPSYEKGIRSLQLVDMRTTDDRGEYRSYRLAPGDYYLAASPRRPTTNGSRGSGASGPQEVTVPTLYPSGLDLTTASPIVLHGGDDVSGMNIQVRSAPAAKLSGRVVSMLPPGPVTGQRGQARPSAASITLMQRDTIGLPDINGGGMVVLNGGGGITANLDGSFEILDIPPGSYDVFARLPVAAYSGWGTANPPARATTPWAFGRISVDVHGTDVENLNIVVRPGVDLKGRVIVDGQPAAGDLQISLQPDDIAANVNDGPSMLTYGQIGGYHPPIGQDGYFTFPLLPEGQYRFQVSFGGTAAQPALASTAYVADIRQGSTSVYDNGIVVGSIPPNSIDVIVNTNGGIIEGTVQDVDGKPASGVTVVLVPPSDRRMNLDLYRTVSSDASGRFDIPRLPPGEYLLFASRTIQPGALQNAEFLAKYSAYAAHVKIAAGLHTRADVKQIPNN